MPPQEIMQRFLRSAMGLSIKYVTQFLANFDPLPPVTLCHTSRDPPKVRHTSRTPRFLVGLVQKSRTKKLPVQILSQLLAGFLSGGFVRGSFVWKVFFGMVLFIPPSVRIHLLQQNGKHHFK